MSKPPSSTKGKKFIKIPKNFFKKLKFNIEVKDFGALLYKCLICEEIKKQNLEYLKAITNKKK